MNKQYAVSWGIPTLDKATGGVPKGLISIIGTPGYLSGSIVLGSFLHEGLSKGETCVMVTYDSADSLSSNFSLLNYNFAKYIEEEKLIFLNYNSDISFESGLTFDYDNIFDEITFMCGGKAPNRIGFQQVDAMVNLNNQVLINASAQKLSAAGTGGKTENTTILGQFIKFNDDTHKQLSYAFEKTMSGYFSLERIDEYNPNYLYFMTKKLPWFEYELQKTHLKLTPSEGLVANDAAISKIS